MAARKYKQIGYMGGTAGPQKRPRQKAPARSPDDIRPAPDPLRARDFFKCSNCGAQACLDDEVPQSLTCENCGADLHSCVNCRFFDSSAPNQCLQPIEAALESKRAANACAHFKPKITVALSVDSTSKATDARQAFADLFKKI